MVEIISLLLSVATSLFSVAVTVNEQTKNKNHAAGTILEQISIVLNEVADKLRNDEVPHGACETIKQLAVGLEQALEDIVENPQHYKNMLIEAHNVEVLYMSTQQDKSLIDEIERAAGKFKSAALLFYLET